MSKVLVCKFVFSIKPAWVLKVLIFVYMCTGNGLSGKRLTESFFAIRYPGIILSVNRIEKLLMPF